MSPTLKAAVPLGSLTCARILPQPSKPDLSVSIGWKKSAIEAAGKTLLEAADKLMQTGETSQFVQGVLKIRAAGWTIVKMPEVADSQQSILKVFYGFQKG